MRQSKANRITWIFIILGCISVTYTSCSENATEVEIRHVLNSNEISIPDLKLEYTTNTIIGVLTKGKTLIMRRPTTELRLLNNSKTAVFGDQDTLDSLKQKIFDQYKIKVALYLIQSTDGTHIHLNENMKLVDLFGRLPVVQLGNKTLVNLYITSQRGNQQVK